MSKKLPLFQRGIKGDFHGRVPTLRIATVRGRFVEPINSIATRSLCGEPARDLQQTKIENRKSRLAIFYPLSSILNAYFGMAFFNACGLIPRSLLR